MIQLSLMAIGSQAHASPLGRLTKGPVMNTKSDVIIIGGGPAGLTAALALGRIGRTVIIFDDNNGRNFPAAHMQNFPSRDGTPPREFKEQLLKDLRNYQEISFRTERVTSLSKNGDGFLVNQTFEAKKIILAHGVKDILPEIPGINDLWGNSVFHCPYCHGHEFKRGKFGLLSSDVNYLSHMVPLIKSLTEDITIFTNGESVELPSFLADVKMITAPVKRLQLTGPVLRSVVTGEIEIPIDALLIKPPQKLTTDLGTKLGCELNEFNLYKVDADSMTTVPGIYGAGDIVEMRQAVIMACASGMKTGANISFALMKEKLVSSSGG